jgi:protein-tyrosine kinase
MLAADDASVILPKIDCVLLVVGNGMSSKREIQDALRHLPGANLLGLVMNKAELSARNNYY